MNLCSRILLPPPPERVTNHRCRKILTKRFGKLGWPQSKKQKPSQLRQIPGLWWGLLRFPILVFSVPDYPNNHFPFPDGISNVFFIKDMKN